MDIVISLGKSLIQHGFFNDRIYLMKIHPDDAGIISQYITDLLTNYNYAKIVMKIPESLEDLFKSTVIVQEARIPGFYQGDEDALFLSRFIDTARALDDAYDQIQKNIQISGKKRHLLPGLLNHWNGRSEKQQLMIYLRSVHSTREHLKPIPSPSTNRIISKKL